jgi:predicted nuclease of predicted toxin-antitoxin system
MRFKVDENLPEELADFFRGRGWDCMTVDEQQLGGALDDRITEICDDEDRILVTLDLGFSNIRDYPPAAHPGYIVFRLKQQDKPSVLKLAVRLVIALSQRELRNELWIVQDERIRVRR